MVIYLKAAYHFHIDVFQVEECQGDQTEPDEEEVEFDFSFSLRNIFSRFLGVVCTAAVEATNQS